MGSVHALRERAQTIRQTASKIYLSYLRRLQRLLVDFNDSRRLRKHAIADEARAHRDMETLLENIHARLRVGTALTIDEVTAYEIRACEIDNNLISARSAISVTTEEALKVLYDAHRAADLSEKELRT